MNLSARRGMGRGWAATLAFALAAVWLAAGCAALSLNLEAASHDCCDAQKGDPACRSLCAATHWSSAPAAAPDWAPAPRIAAADCGTLRVAPEISPRVEPAPLGDPSTPLYIRNASLLI